MRFPQFAAAALATSAGLALVPSGAAAPRIAPAPNPCLDPAQAAELLCPRLDLSRPSHLKLDRRTRRGRVLLRAQNSINSVCAGPIPRDAQRAEHDARGT